MRCMNTCRVLRCQNPGSAVITGGHNLNRVHESFICDEHKEQIDAGAAWDMPDGHVVMGQDMPPALEKWTARDSMGTQGFTLTLETSDPEAKPFDVFITPGHAKMLSSLLSSRGE